MKKLLVLLSLVILSGCMKDEIFEPIQQIPDNLKIETLTGIKLESSIVTEEVSVNVKLSSAGTYKIKIRDIGRNLVSQDKIQGQVGDNILKVYVLSLPKDSYILELTDELNNVIGLTTFVVI